jgi:hypothetical protein
VGALVVSAPAPDGRSAKESQNERSLSTTIGINLLSMLRPIPSNVWLRWSMQYNCVYLGCATGVHVKIYRVYLYRVICAIVELKDAPIFTFSQSDGGWKIT